MWEPAMRCLFGKNQSKGLLFLVMVLIPVLEDFL
jgi:hypothetical protein